MINTSHLKLLIKYKDNRQAPNVTYFKHNRIDFKLVKCFF